MRRLLEVWRTAVYVLTLRAMAKPYRSRRVYVAGP
jgi:hypothetical protein